MPLAVRKQSFGSITVFSVDKKVVKEILWAWVLQLRSRPEMLAVICLVHWLKAALFLEVTSMCFWSSVTTSTSFESVLSSICQTIFPFWWTCFPTG